MVVIAEALGADAKVLTSAQTVLGRVLVDADGKEAPFPLAVKEISDTRLMPDVPRTEQFTLAAAGAKQVRVRAVWHASSEAIAARVTVPQREPFVLAQTTVTVGASGKN